MTPLFVVWVSLCMSVIDFCFVTDHRENNHYFLPPSHSFFWRFQSTFARVLILLKNAAFWRKFSNHQSGPWPHLTFFKSTSIRPQLLTLDLIAASRTMKFFLEKRITKMSPLNFHTSEVQILMFIFVMNFVRKMRLFVSIFQTMCFVSN